MGLQRPPTVTGRYSPLRYPGGKGKLAKFVRALVKENRLCDGRYVEPFAGGAAIAWELLLTGVVRRVSINDYDNSVYSFWASVLDNTDKICELIHNSPLTVEFWDKQKTVLKNKNSESALDIGFAFFYLNRTNRSGIINGGLIGGRNQSGLWKMDARFNKPLLIEKIQKIAERKSHIQLTNLDAIEFMKQNFSSWDKNTLIYLDPPYFEKGKFLYYNSFKTEDHEALAASIENYDEKNWIVSYDSAPEIRSLYRKHKEIRYLLNYSARNATRGHEVMYFSKSLRVPAFAPPMMAID